MRPESVVNENIVSCQLLVSAIATEPEIFMEIIGEDDYDAELVSEYFSGILDIMRGTE